MWFPNRSDTNRPVQSQKRARSLKFWSQVEKELYYPCSENKGADQLRGYRYRWFSHGAAHFFVGIVIHVRTEPLIQPNQSDKKVFTLRAHTVSQASSYFSKGGHSVLPEVN